MWHEHGGQLLGLGAWLLIVGLLAWQRRSERRARQSADEARARLVAAHLEDDEPTHVTRRARAHRDAG